MGMAFSCAILAAASLAVNYWEGVLAFISLTVFFFGYLLYFSKTRTVLK